MPADRADSRRRDPPSLQGGAPAATRGLLKLVSTRPPQDQVAAEAPSPAALVNNAPAAAFAGAFVGCLTTLHFGASGFVPAIASALATILLCGALLITRTTSLFPGELFAAIYGGSFAGMTPVLALSDNTAGASIIPTSALFILLSIVSGLAFCAVAEIDARSGRRLAGGCGGRSGAIATVASFVFVEAARLLGADGQLFHAVHADLLDVDPRALALACAAGMIGLSATMAVLRRRGAAVAEPAERIVLAAAVALIGLEVLHLIDPNDPHTMDAFYAGCFLGMSTPERLQGWVQAVLGALLLTAMLVIVKTMLPDVGGELGFAAFVTVAVLLAPSRMTTWLATDDPAQRNRPQAAGSGRLTAGRPLRTAITMAGSLAGLALIGWLALPGQVASEEPADETEASAPVAEQPGRPLEQAALVQAKPDAVNEAVAASTASADAVNPDLGLSLELNDTAVPAAHGVVDAAGARAEPGRPDHADVASTATSEAAPSAAPLDDVAKYHEALFREFIRWRTAHSAAVAQPRPQAVRRPRNSIFQMVRLTPPATIRTAPRAPAHVPAVHPLAGPSRP
jgi:hypothetical protein